MTTTFKNLNKIQNLLYLMSDSTRLRILFCLLDEGKCNCKCYAVGKCSKCKCLSCMIEKNVTEIVESVHLSQSLVSHQLKSLKDGKIVTSRKEGKNVYYSLKDGHIKELLSMVLEHVMEDEKV